MATTLLLTLAVFALAMLIMSVGVIFSGRCLRGSCGGPNIFGPDGESLSCAACPKRKEREEASRAEVRSEGLPVLEA